MGKLLDEYGLAELVDKIKDADDTKMAKVSSAVLNNIATYDSNGQVKDSGVAITLIKDNVYGIKRSLTTSSSGWTRTDNAFGLVANATKDGTAVVNDFDDISPWKDIISVNMGNDGLITARYGDANFKFDGTNGEVMTLIPAFYWKRWQDTEYEYIQISNANFDGATYSSPFYVGRYQTESGAHSYGGVPQVSTNITTFRNQAEAKGTGWQQLDYHYFLLQMLYLVEYADYNSQTKLGNGITSVRYTTTDVALLTESSVNRIVISSSYASYYVVGTTICIGTARGNTSVCAYRTITSKETTDDGVAIYFDGSAVNITAGNVLWQGVQIQGQCNSLGMKSGCLNNDSKHACIYRGIENPFGNCYQFVDGINIQNNVAYVNYNPDTYAVDTFTGDYSPLAYTNATSNGYGKTLGYDSSQPMISFDIEVGGGSTTYLTDYYYQNTGNRIAFVGGYFSAGAFAGLWFWNLSDSSSAALIFIGARLLKK